VKTQTIYRIVWGFDNGVDGKAVWFAPDREEAIDWLETEAKGHHDDSYATPCEIQEVEAPAGVGRARLCDLLNTETAPLRGSF
jgi:hypothetical protein